MVQDIMLDMVPDIMLDMVTDIHARYKYLDMDSVISDIYIIHYN